MMTIKIHEDGIDRQATKDEIEEIKAKEAESKLIDDEIAAEKNAKATAKNAIAERLGLTVDELATLLA